jgi:hypothetical protein
VLSWPRSLLALSRWARIRQDSQVMLRTTDRRSSRSSMSAETTGASKIFPQEVMPRLVFSAVEP